MTAGAASPGPEDAGPGRVAVVGPGRVGQSLAAALASAGRPVTLRGRRPDPPPLLDGLAGVPYGEGVPSSPDGAPATVVFCVPDDALAGVAGAWARALERAGGAGPPDDGEGAGGPAASAPGRPGSPVPVALHTSGVHPADVLSPLRAAGRSVAAWHPLMALAAPRADAFRGITFAVEGDGPAEERARALTREVGGRPLGLEAGAHARYHAAAVFASNFLVACLSVAARELAAATGGEGSPEDLLPLARAAVENLEADGLAAGATGPLTRGDAGTVARHLEALPEASGELYRRLARELLAVVEGRLAPDEADELRRVLAGDPDAGGGSGG